MPRPNFATTPANPPGAPQEAETAAEAHIPPPTWLKNWRKRHDGQAWGFVGFRTACYGEEAQEAEQWEEFKKRVRQIIEIPMRTAIEQGYPRHEIDAARAKFEIRWIEEPALAGADADTLRARYAALLPGFPPGLSLPHQSLSVFLCASPEAVASVLALDPEEMPTSESPFWRSNAPFLLAVAPYTELGLEEGHEEIEWFKPVFKVAVEVLVEELWWLLEADFTTLSKVTRLVRGSNELGRLDDRGGRDDLEDMWWSMHPSPERMRKKRQIRGGF